MIHELQFWTNNGRRQSPSSVGTSITRVVGPNQFKFGKIVATSSTTSLAVIFESYMSHQDVVDFLRDNGVAQIHSGPGAIVQALMLILKAPAPASEPIITSIVPAVATTAKMDPLLPTSTVKLPPIQVFRSVNEAKHFRKLKFEVEDFDLSLITKVARI